MHTLERICEQAGRQAVPEKLLELYSITFGNVLVRPGIRPVCSTQNECRSDKGILGIGCCSEEIPTDRTLEHQEERNESCPLTWAAASMQANTTMEIRALTWASIDQSNET